MNTHNNFTFKTLPVQAFRQDFILLIMARCSEQIKSVMVLNTLVSRKRKLSDSFHRRTSESRPIFLFVELESFDT